MAAASVAPARIRIAVDPNETSAIQDFVILKRQAGTLTASIAGGGDVIMLKEFIALAEIKVPLTDEEIEQLPPHLRDNPDFHFSVEASEVARTGDGVPMAVERDWRVRGEVAFTRPAGQGLGFHEAELVISGVEADPIEIPILFVIGPVEVEFLGDPIVTLQNSWTPFQVRITLPGAPDTDLTLEATGMSTVARTEVRVPQGRSVDVMLRMLVLENAPLGLIETTILITGHSETMNRISFVAEVRPPIPPAPTPAERLASANAAIRDFHSISNGLLVVGSEVGPTRELPNGVYEQRYRFGSVLKPLNGPPVVATRYSLTINIAAIKCFGTEDPSGEDEPYIVFSAYSVDPVVGTGAAQTGEIHFGPVSEKAVFAHGRPLLQHPLFVPGDGRVQLVIALWDEELARPAAIQETWRDITTMGILAGLTLLNPVAGATATTIETMKGIVTDTSRELVRSVTDILGLADDHLGTREFSIDTDFLGRLIADGTGLPRRSPSISGIAYNFPELPESNDATGRSWLFEGGGGSYRIFMTVQAGETQLSPQP